MEPKFAEMSDHYKGEIRRMKDKLEAQEKLLSQNEEQSMHLRQRLIQVTDPRDHTRDPCVE